MRLQLAAAAVAGAAVAILSVATVNANHNGRFNVQVVDLSFRRDLLVIECEDRNLHGEQLADDIFLVTCGRFIDDLDRDEGHKHRLRGTIDFDDDDDDDDGNGNGVHRRTEGKIEDPGHTD